MREAEENSVLFREAKNEEIRSMTETDSVEEADLKDAMNLVPTRWVLTWKLDEFGRPYKAKARQVAIGFRDREKTTVPSEAHTPSKEAPRCLFHIAVQCQTRVHKWDAKRSG